MSLLIKGGRVGKKSVPLKSHITTHNASADCLVCLNTVEDAEHVFFNCIRFEEGREKLHRQLQEVARPENIVQLMLADEKNWLAVATFAHSVITSLRAEEMARRR
ncbi:hypothetical protein TKK_0016656 [Trichogramma kaykai]